MITLHRINHIHAGTFKLRYPQNSDICSYVDKEKQNLTERERVEEYQAKASTGVRVKVMNFKKKA